MNSAPKPAFVGGHQDYVFDVRSMAAPTSLAKMKPRQPPVNSGLRGVATWLKPFTV
jgi:hypothetical protein